MKTREMLLWVVILLNGPGYAWGVEFRNDDVGRYDKNNQNDTRCVRCGQRGQSPRASFEDAYGQPSEFPEILRVGESYIITTKYTDTDGAGDLKECCLRINQPGFPLTMGYNVSTDTVYRWSGAEGENYLSPVSVTRQNLGDGSGIILQWNFFVRPNWPLVSGGIDFQVYVEDQSEQTDGWNSAGLSLAYSAPEFGATIITHGYMLSGNDPPEWTRTMGRAIGRRLGRARVSQLNPSAGLFIVIDGGEISEYDASGREEILIMNWAQESNEVLTRGFSEAAADAFAAALIRYQSNNPGYYFLERLHFIGHSRGCVVNSEIIERLIKLSKKKALIKGVSCGNLCKKTSVTYLDPHPVFGWEGDADKVNPGNDKQGQIEVWDGVTYADNYYQPNHFPDGMAINGAYNRNLDDIDDYDFGHSEVHAWYFGTIDPDATQDELLQMMREVELQYSEIPRKLYTIKRDLWYSDKSGLIEGFAYSPHGGNIENRCAPSEVTIPYFDYKHDALFNGNFEFHNVDIPGWQFQGGGGDGRIVDFEHLELGHGNLSRTHNWCYVPSNAKKISFNYKVISASSGSPPNTDKLQVFVDNGSVCDLLVDNIRLNQITGSYIRKSFDVSDYAGFVVKLMFQISEYGSAHSKVLIDDVKFKFRTAMPWMPLMFED